MIVEVTIKHKKAQTGGRMGKMETLVVYKNKGFALLNPEVATQSGIERYIKASQREGAGSSELCERAAKDIGGVKFVDIEYRFGVMHRFGAEDWMHGKHPDQRMVRVDYSALLPSEIKTRHGAGYCLSDGAYYDPSDRLFYGFETVE